MSEVTIDYDKLAAAILRQQDDERIHTTDVPGDGYYYSGPTSPHVDHDGANLLALASYYDGAVAVGRRRVLTKFAEVTAAQSGGALDVFQDMIDQSTDALSIQMEAVAQTLRPQVRDAEDGDK